MQPLATNAGEAHIKRYEPNRFMPAHKHEFDKVSFMLSGSVTERRGMRCEHIKAGWMVVKPAGVLHEDLVGADGLCTLTLIAKQHPCTAETWKAILADYRWLPIDRSLGKLLRLVTRRVESTPDAVDEVIFALAARTTREVRSNDDWYARAFSNLKDRFDSPPTLEELARHVAVHPVTLSKAFAERGTSKSEIVHRYRIHRAMQMIPSAKSFAWIAAELGYADAAHFSRSFRLWTGLTPREYRAKFCTRR